MNVKQWYRYNIDIGISLSICCIHLFIPLCVAFANVILKCLSIRFTEREQRLRLQLFRPTTATTTFKNMKEACWREEGLWGNDAIDTSLRYRWLVPRRFPFTFPWLLYIVVPFAWLNCFWPACLAACLGLSAFWATLRGWTGSPTSLLLALCLLHLANKSQNAIKVSTPHRRRRRTLFAAGCMHGGVMCCGSAFAMLSVSLDSCLIVWPRPSHSSWVR